MLLVLGLWNVLYANLQIIESRIERRLHYPQNQLPLNCYSELHMRQSPYFIHNQKVSKSKLKEGYFFSFSLEVAPIDGVLYVSFYYGCLIETTDMMASNKKYVFSQSSGSLKSRVRKSCSLWSSSVESGLASSWFLVVAKQRAVFLGFCHLVSTYVFKFLPPCVSQCLCVLISIFSLMKTSVFGFRAYSHLVWFTSTNYIYRDLSKYNLFLSFLVDAHFLLNTIQPVPSACFRPALYMVLCIPSGFSVSFFSFFACTLLPNPAQNVLLPTSTTSMLCGTQFMSLSILRIFKTSVYLFGHVGSLLHHTGCFIIGHGLFSCGPRAPRLQCMGLVAPWHVVF